MYEKERLNFTKDPQIVNRVIRAAKYFYINGSTVRETAEEFEVSKSTIHIDLTERIRILDPEMYIKAREVLDKNLAERALRGGNATKRKYEELKIKNNT